jgi:hypothetical protein
MMVLCYCDDQIVCCQDQRKAQQLMKELSREFALTDEVMLVDYLGIHLKTLSNGTFKMTQTGLIDKLITAAGTHGLQSQ